MIWKTFLISLFLMSCNQVQQVSQEALYESDAKIGDTLAAGRYSNIYFSAQPSFKDWKALKEQGFTHIINFRGESEIDLKAEEKEIEGLGMIYTHLPMDMSQPLTKDHVQLVTKAVVAHRKKGKTLLHCGSGARVAYWAGAHFYLDHKYSEEESINMAEKLGLKSSKVKKMLMAFMSKNKRTEK